VALLNNGVAQHGVFDAGGSAFDSFGYLTTEDRTIEVVAGVLVRPIPRVTVTFDGNGHTAGMVPAPVQGVAGDEFPVPGRGDMANGDLFFVGWNTSPGAAGSAYFADGMTIVIGDDDVTLYAIWSEFGIDRLTGTIIGFSGMGGDLVIPSVINTVQVSAIGDGADWWSGVFTGRQLTSVVIPGSVTRIGNWAFTVNQLTSVNIPSSVHFIGEEAFAGNQLTTVSIPEGVAFIGLGAFSDNELTSIVIPSSVTSIGDYAFSLNQLTSVAIPESVTGIGIRAFMRNQLTSIVIPDSVSSIGFGAFSYNPLASITIPAHVSIGDDNAMGTRGAAFLDFYNSTGQRAGTYLWIEAESRWILYGDTGGAGIYLYFVGFTDVAEYMDINADLSVSVLDSPAYITVANHLYLGAIRWIHDGVELPGANEATLDFAALHRNRIGTHFVTVEVMRGITWYSRHIRIQVTR